MPLLLLLLRITWIRQTPVLYAVHSCGEKLVVFSISWRFLCFFLVQEFSIGKRLKKVILLQFLSIFMSLTLKCNKLIKFRMCGKVAYEANFEKTIQQLWFSYAGFFFSFFFPLLQLGGRSHRRRRRSERKIIKSKSWTLCVCVWILNDF